MDKHEIDSVKKSKSFLLTQETVDPPSFVSCSLPWNGHKSIKHIRFKDTGWDKVERDRLDSMIGNEDIISWKFIGNGTSNVGEKTAICQDKFRD